MSDLTTQFREIQSRIEDLRLFVCEWRESLAEILDAPAPVEE